MRVSAAPFAGHASGGPPAAAHLRDAELRGRHLGHAAKADDLQLKVRRAGLHFRTSTRPTGRSALPQRTDIVSSTSYQSVDFGSGVELGSRRDRALRASRIEIKIDRITKKSGDISKKQLDFLFLLLLWAASV